jgi:hypothetical protein
MGSSTEGVFLFLIMIVSNSVTSKTLTLYFIFVVVFSQFYVPPASLRGHYGADIPAFHGGGRPQVPLRAIFRLERAPG